MNEEYFSAADLINKTFENISIADVNKATDVYDVWTRVVSRVKGKVNPNEGRNIASHSRIVDLKNGVLLVEVDHSGWIELIQLHKNYIMKGLKIEKPELDINTIAFRLKGKKAEIFNFENSDEKFNEAQAKAFERINRQEKGLEQMGFVAETRKPQEMPDQLKNLFNRLKADMLTNNKDK